MRMTHTLILALSALSLAGCISYPNTKALVTPVGAVGFHTFAPPRQSPDEMSAAAQTQRLAEAMKSRDEEEPTAN